MRSREGQGRVKGASRQGQDNVKTRPRVYKVHISGGRGGAFFFFKASGCTSSKELKSLDLPLLG